MALPLSPLTLLWLALVAIAVLLVAVVYWRHEVRIPRVISEVLPPYEIPDVAVIGTALVENRGRAPAIKVQVTVAYDPVDWAQIHHLRIVCEGEYVLRGGGELHSYATVRLREMKPGQKLLIYMAGPRPVIPRVDISEN